MIQKGRGGGGSGSSNTSSNNNNNYNKNNRGNNKSTRIKLWSGLCPKTLGADFTPGLISIDYLLSPFVWSCCFPICP